MAETVQPKEVSKDLEKDKNLKVLDDDENKAKLRWFDERGYCQFFQYHKMKTEKTFQVKCLSCPSKILSVTVNSAYNLKTHYETVHASIYQGFLEKTKKRKTDEDQDDVIPNKQLKMTKYCNTRVINQSQLDRLVFNYIIEGMCTFSTVEKPSFKKLVLAGNCNDLHVMTRKSLVQMLSKEFQLMKNGQIGEYSNIQYFCITTDLWSSHRRAFLGVTIHWICSQSYTRQQNVLSCRRIKGTHSSKVIAFHIDEIIKSFEIPLYKILKIITDGGTNFAKAFKDHQVNDKENEHVIDDGDEYPDVTDLLDENDSNDNILLLKHGRCASHKLSLTLTSDTKSRPKPKKNVKENGKRKEKVLTSEEVEQKNFQEEFYVFRETTLDPVLEKCRKLFNKQSNSAKSADLIHSHLKRYLVVPNETRWNALYDSVVLLSELMDSKPVEMSKIFTALGLQKIESHEHVILKEYIEITKSVAASLDFFQGEQYMYTGVYAPTLHQLKEKLNKISDLKYCMMLKEMILKSIDKRFPDAMDDEYLMASLLHPLFKTFPMFTPELKSRIVKKIVVELQYQIDESIQISTSTETSTQDSQVKTRSDVSNLKTFKELFDFDEEKGFAGSTTTSWSSTLKAEMLLQSYYNYDDKSIKSLEKFPEIGKLFIKKNTCLCSSAPSERLFSMAKNIFESDRCSLKDENFESQLLLKVNRDEQE